MLSSSLRLLVIAEPLVQCNIGNNTPNTRLMVCFGTYRRINHRMQTMFDNDRGNGRG